MGPVCNWNATQHWAIGVAFGDHFELIFFVYKQVYLCLINSLDLAVVLESALV